MRQSTKHLNINCLSELSNALKSHTTNTDFKMLFITGAGIILAEIEEPLDGKPTLDDYLSDMKNDQFNINAIASLKHEAIDQLKSEDEVAGDTFNFIGDGSMIFLKNVNFYHSLDESPYLTLASFALHATDVIGFTLLPHRV